MIRKQIIEECAKYGYIFSGEMERDCVHHFVNANVREEINLFDVYIDKDFERVAMALIMDMSSWNEATEHDYNDIEDIKEGINSWISKENLEEAEKWLEEE